MIKDSPIMSAKDGTMFTEWIIEDDSPEWYKLQEFVKSEFYPIVRKKLTFRASEITESLVFNTNADSVRADQGAVLEILDLIAFFDEFLEKKELVPDSPSSSDDING